MGRAQDFTNSIIYHIRHMESKEVVYVGSTTNFSNRKGKHKYLWNKEGNHFKIPIYCHIRDNGGFDCFEIIPIQSLKLENKTQLLIAEQVEIDRHSTLVNSYKAHTTFEEKRIDNIEKCKKWWENNSEKLKKYYQENKENINEKHKNYREANKEQIKEKRKEKIECKFCSKLLSKWSISRHIKICQSKPKDK